MNIFEGLKVLELSTTIAAPAVGKMLGDWGADVIKVEPPNADSWRLFMPTSFNKTWSPDMNPVFELYNSNKRMACINLKEAKGMEAFFKLLDQADIFITNNRASALEKMGLDYETLHKKYPKMIYASVNGYGEFGPEAANPGYDTASFWARSGLTADLTPTGSAPVTVAGGFGDTTTGLSVMAGVCAALFHRERTGEGTYVSSSLYGAGLWASAMHIVLSEDVYGNKWPKPRNMGNPINANYWTKDGEMVNITIVDWTRYFKDLCKAVGCDDLIEKFPTYLSMLEGRVEVFNRMAEAFAKFDSDVLVAKFKEIGITCSKMKHWHEQWCDPQAIANGYVTPMKYDDGTEMMRVNPSFYFKHHAPVETKNAGKLGEHTVEILKQLNYQESEIKEMLETGAAVQHA